MQKIFDLIIIGAGPAGLTASIYASCYHLNHLVIGKEIGGQLQYAPDILNYPGFTDISGKELTQRLVKQVKKHGTQIITQSVISINKDIKSGGYTIQIKTGESYLTKALIIATGSERKKLNIPGEAQYIGRGVHYCATCEKQDYQDQICAVVGGGNSATQAAVELSQAAGKVYIFYRGSQLRGDPIWLKRIEDNDKIIVKYNTLVTEIKGDENKVTGICFINNPTTQESAGGEENYEIEIDKIFIEIGGVPGTALVIPLGLDLDSYGHIKVNENMETNLPGIFAAGDIVKFGLSLEQISTAVGLGARATASAFSYVIKEKTPVVWGQSQIQRPI
ncbi:hypothetical protein A2Y99_04525 [Candidatus Gottesmanbacteria bacterium RBG_13_37_7]|uniref:FAD/NAD(P)-binding domain-containing protein n=1 Tax=Candidatus Gottesmanbacteria bacterium RBG_13_37_7 TaxID=1798369 RepID=A0A1F5YGW5_9BACT|nr:MAG: hypothetical protein A2Y99_04525 [Candidatus Gottesmanbacteria bacterium RBG_13_37_7]